MTITPQQYLDLLSMLDVCIERIKKLEVEHREGLADVEKLKGRVLTGAQSTNRCFDAIGGKLKKHDEHITVLLKVATDVTKVVFPERCVEGLKPDFLIERDPKKMI
jgi:hypothetical protein